MRALNIRTKVLLAFSMVSLASTVAFTSYAYMLQRRTILDGIDNKLRTAALAVTSLLPDDLHERLLKGTNVVSSAEHSANMERLTEFVRQAGVSYVYSFVKYGTNIHFSSTSASDEQVRGEEPTVGFMEVYGDPTDADLQIFDNGQPLAETSEDEFGSFRSVLIPQKTPGGQVYVVGADLNISEVKAQLRRTLELCISIGLGSFLAVFIIAMVLSNRISGPVVELSREIKNLGARDFAQDEEGERRLTGLATRSRDEIGALAEAFTQMLGKLREYIINLKETTAAKERIESELKIAHDIQMSFLPKIFPPFPNRKEFDLFAAIEPAKEVGGDLYDFCMLDDDRLFFVVGDVSDKGVPAALFMAVTMTLMKRTAQMVGSDPAEILRRVNADLLPENENLLFVTVVCGVLNIKTGELIYSNAGHNPPVLMRTGGVVEYMKLPDGIVLGVMPDAPYQNKTLSLGTGDALLIYTDGVTEAMSPTHVLYSEELLIKEATALLGTTPEQTVKRVIQSVKIHANGAPQSDDITVLVIKMQP